MTRQLLNAIGATDLTAYFEFLDGLRESGATNMYGAAPYLEEQFPGMCRVEARTIAQAWRDTFSTTLPADDRAMNALEGV